MSTSVETSDPFFLIRATIEAELAAPGVLVVSSAVRGDGKTGVTAGVVRSLAAAGYSTLAVDAAANVPYAVNVDDAGSLLAESARPSQAGCDVLSIAPAQARAASANAIAAFYKSARSRYDYTVVDAAVIGTGGLAFARAADGVMLTLREGRAVDRADRETVELFERLRVRFLGVVATRSDGGTDAALSLADRLQLRLRSLVTVSEETVRGVASYGQTRAPQRSAV